jgi:hypothetical protein
MRAAKAAKAGSGLSSASPRRQLVLLCRWTLSACLMRSSNSRSRLPCKSLSRRKIFSQGAFRRSAHAELWQNPQLARVPLGDGSCHRRTRHPFTVSDPCGPSQKVKCVFSASPETIQRQPREFDLRRSVGNRRTWQSARCVILFFFARRGAVSRPLRSADVKTERRCVLLDPPRAYTPPSFELQPASLDWHFLSAFLFHRPGPDHDPVWVPASRLPRAHVGYAFCVVWKAVCASFCRRSSFRHRKARSN